MYNTIDNLPLTRKAYGMDELQIVKLDELTCTAMIELANLPTLELTEKEFENNGGFFGDLEIANNSQYFLIQVGNRIAYVDTQGYTYCRYAVELEPGF